MLSGVSKSINMLRAAIYSTDVEDISILQFRENEPSSQKRSKVDANLEDCDDARKKKNRRPSGFFGFPLGASDDA